jgi:hypothetical protein
MDKLPNVYVGNRRRHLIGWQCNKGRGCLLRAIERYSGSERVSLNGSNLNSALGEQRSDAADRGPICLGGRGRFGGIARRCIVARNGRGTSISRPAVDHGSHFHRGRFIRRAGARCGRCHVTRIRQAGSGGQWAGGSESVAHAAPDGYTILFGPTVHSASGPRFIRICDTIPSAISRRSESLHELPLLLINGYEGLKRFEMTEMASWLLREHCRRDRGSTGATPTNVQPRAFAVLITRSKLIVRQR